MKDWLKSTELTGYRADWLAELRQQVSDKPKHARALEALIAWEDGGQVDEDYPEILDDLPQRTLIALENSYHTITNPDGNTYYDITYPELRRQHRVAASRRRETMASGNSLEHLLNFGEK